MYSAWHLFWRNYVPPVSSAVASPGYTVTSRQESTQSVKKDGHGQTVKKVGNGVSVP